MQLFSITLGVICFYHTVYGAAVSAPIHIDECALRRCPDSLADCDEQTSLDPCCTICTTGRKCYHKGQWYDSGKSFTDGCNSCFCNNGIVRCTMRECLDTSCLYKGKTYASGVEFKDDCNTCTCLLGKVSCTEMDCGRGCYYKGEYHADGSTLKDDCNTCFCRNGSVGCTEIGCRPSRCYFNGIYYDDGDTMPSKNPCEICTCKGGKRLCDYLMCPAVWCEGQTRVPGKCCPVCPPNPVA